MSEPIPAFPTALEVATAQRRHNTALAEYFPDESEAAVIEPVKLTLRRPSELVSMVFDDSDNILGDRLFCRAQSLVIAGQGGIGKSRFINQTIASVVTKQDFLKFKTGGAEQSWLILQNENSNRRLHDDFSRIKYWLGTDNMEIFNQRVTIQCLEKDSDSFVSLDLIENQRKLEAAIAEVKPDNIVIDPLASFAIGDINKDADMQATLRTLSKICRKDNPQRGIIVAHHALTGKAGAAKAVGYDRSSFGRNSKALLAWARGQINIAAVGEDNHDRIIVACGKCSNAREFEPFAAALNADMIYELDDSVDVKVWQDGIAGKEPPLASPEDVKRMCKILTSRSDLARKIMSTGVSRPTAYRLIVRAARLKLISIDRNTDNCSPL